MAARNPARYLAPVALAATIAGGYLIVHNNLKERSHASSSHSASSTILSHSKHHKDKPHNKYAKARFYTVKSGDSLTAIAAFTGIPLSTLIQLNPRINPNALQTGQRLRLRR
jgi:LysM repeat protein